jgi:hypothetical protein
MTNRKTIDFAPPLVNYPKGPRRGKILQSMGNTTGWALHFNRL